jgi:hypothetical protein
MCNRIGRKLSIKDPTPLLLLTTSLVAIAGCRPEAEIRSYIAPKEQVPAAAESPAAAAGPPTHRMLAAILPDKDQAWFYKVVGSITEIGAVEAEVLSYFNALKLNRDGGRPIATLVEGWQEQAGTGMRAATFMIPAGEKTLEMSVSRLSWSGDRAENILANVNRWRGQLQLPPITQDSLADSIRSSGEGSATIVDLTGNLQNSPMANGSPTLPQRNADAALPLSMKPPDSWTRVPPSGMFRKASFVVSVADQRVDVTVMDFPTNAPAIAELLPNVNRWRDELGLPPISEDELVSYSEPIEIDGRPGTMVELEAPPGTERPRATRAAMVNQGDVVWFFKMIGDRALVQRETGRFRELLDSVRF